MKSKQFPTFDDAVAYLKSRGGEVKYNGVIGYNEYYCYTLTMGIKVYHVDIYADGMLTVTYERYKNNDE